MKPRYLLAFALLASCGSLEKPGAQASPKTVATVQAEIKSLDLGCERLTDVSNPQYNCKITAKPIRDEAFEKLRDSLGNTGEIFCEEDKDLMDEVYQQVALKRAKQHSQFRELSLSAEVIRNQERKVTSVNITSSTNEPVGVSLRYRSAIGTMRGQVYVCVEFLPEDSE
jgi:polyhydroxyalkanoate synthesis regulator phasin